MKRILLIKDEHSFWATVEYLFREVNVEIISFEEDSNVNSAFGAQPDLVMMSVASLPRLPPNLRNKPRIVFVTENPGSGEQSQPLPEQNQQILGWPRDRAKLREIASVVLGIPPRKEFKTLVRIFRGEDPHGCIGSSIDFSLTGMAFSAERTFVTGSQVGIALSLPGGNESVRFRLNILRCVDKGHGSGRIYGGEYVNMPNDALKRVTSFLYER
ncbi:MAG: PilZ domain-containing protein [Candidatus Methylomirabilia bacterium]